MDVGTLAALLSAECRGTDYQAAAAALAAGEPKRALAVLDALPTDQQLPLAPPLRTAALHMDVNWQPGACLAPVQGLAQAMAQGAGDLPEGNLRLAAFLAGQVIPVLLSARMIVGHAGRAHDAREREAHPPLDGGVASERDQDLREGVEQALRWFDDLHATIAESGHTDAAACHLLLAADLRIRAGGIEVGIEAGTLPAAPGELRHTPTGSRALRELLQGDRELGAPGTAEECVVTPRAPGAVGSGGILRAAERRYESALAACTAARAPHGRAAALLRLAHVHRIQGRGDTCRTRLASALDAAYEAKDGACAALLQVHQVLDLIDADSGEGTEAAVAKAVAVWGRTVGSTSWVHGLSWLVRNRADSWYAEGYARSGDRAEAFARLLSEDRAPSSAGPSAVAVPTTDTAVQARHHGAALVLIDLEQREHLARIRHDDQRGALDLTRCLGVVRTAKAFHTQATELGDPEVAAAARARLELAVHVGELVVRETGTGTGTGTETGTETGTGTETETGTWIADPMRDVLAGLRSDLAACPAQESLFHSRRAREAGLGDEADRLAQQALDRARSIPDDVLRCHVRCTALTDLGDRARARAEAERMESRLPALQAAALWVRLGDPARARRCLPHVGDAVENSWQLLSLRAETAGGEGTPTREAGEYALRGLAAYEEHRNRLARDTLRASFADDPVAARLHHVAVLARLASGEEDAPAVAFGQADRVRTGFLGAVRALDAAAADPAARAAVRHWLATEVRWAAEFEDHVAALRAERGGAPGAATAVPERSPSPSWPSDPSLPPTSHPTTAVIRRRVDTAALRLGEAEAVVRRRAPSALAAAERDVVPDPAAVAGALPDGAVLLAYHLFDDALIGWAMTRDTLRCEPLRGRPGGRALTHQVVGAARRFRDGCADPLHEGHGQDDAALLAAWLLEPFAEVLDTARRVVVVPPAALALLPFHTLPWDGDVLGAHRPVSYLPAAGLLPRLRERGDPRPWRDLDALLVGAPATDARHRLPELPGTAAEIAEIARLLPRTTVLTGARAGRAEVLATAPGHEVVHLATHGVIDELAPNRSRLPLAGDDALDLADLLTAAHAPRLLVLSACDTGRGRATAGGDVLGLTRAALVTGARNAIVSLWPVRDDLGALVMTRMYRHLAGDGQLTEGGTVDVGTALHLAQQEVRALGHAAREAEYGRLTRRTGGASGTADGRRSWAAGPRDSSPARLGPALDDRHPYHWAPFIHVGV
ncbi:CHAT domain-containing protein [Streptomyces griseoruber]|uniref:CHAT domain-containing protein n=1 Tax=Streptomyces griseoruber TaxID=1943 RepID=UPI0037A14CC6